MGCLQDGSTEANLPALFICFEHVPFPEAFLEGKVLFPALALRSVRSSEDQWQPQSVQCVCMQHVSRMKRFTRGFDV